MAENWTIISQRQTSDLGGDGRFRQVMEINYVDSHDIHGQIIVPLTQYSAAHVKELIDERVATAHAVHNL